LECTSLATTKQTRSRPARPRTSLLTLQGSGTAVGESLPWPSAAGPEEA
jgi:hypothetical protein